MIITREQQKIFDNAIAHLEKEVKECDTEIERCVQKIGRENDRKSNLKDEIKGLLHEREILS